MPESKFLPVSSLLDQMTNEMSKEELAEMRYYELLNDFAIALIEYRTAHNLSQQDLARYLGCAQTMVYRYESGEYNISLKAICNVCTKLNIDFNLSFVDATPASAPVQEIHNEDPDLLAAAC